MVYTLSTELKSQSTLIPIYPIELTIESKPSPWKALWLNLKSLPIVVVGVVIVGHIWCAILR